MATMKHRILNRGKETADRAGVASAKEAEELRERMAVLEEEVQECRQLNLRIAELTDVVAELLLPIAQRDEARVAELLDRYSKSL